jgi:endonuclease/exonuclease/phosphatase (EEP) superfamily protein YafD
MTWNIYKSQAKHWTEDFVRLSTDRDLLLLQEAHLTPAFLAQLEQSGYRWFMVRAFDLGGAETGVLTAGPAPVFGTCLSRTAEPLIRLPKSALLVRYRLTGSSKELWVANVHGINFTLGALGFEAQLESLAQALAPHDGPLVLAGDFNDWNVRRRRILQDIVRRLDLVPLRLAVDRRSRHWGRPLDHIFYRGLQVIEADAVEVATSDHNPVRVTFGLAEHTPKE